MATMVSFVKLMSRLFVKLFKYFRFEAYEDNTNKDEKNFASYENTAVFCVSMFQYISEAVIFSKGAPYRRSIFSNVWFVVMLIFMFACSLVILLVPSTGLLDFFMVLF
jgi:magnesium-transporting ATPase (P-type)